MQSIYYNRNNRLGYIFRYLLALVMLVVAFLLRFWLLPVENGYPGLTIYPAAILSFLVCGFGPGTLVTCLGIGFSFYFFLNPCSFRFKGR